MMIWGAFVLLSLLALGGALGVVWARKVVHSVLFLILSFLGVAGLYVLLAAPFLAVVQVLIYVGAVAVLILFTVMITRRPGQPEDRGWTSLRWPAALVVGLGTVGLGWLLWRTPWSGSSLAEAPTVADLGTMLVSQYALPFELASIVLLVALLGAAMIARGE